MARPWARPALPRAGAPAHPRRAAGARVLARRPGRRARPRRAAGARRALPRAPRARGGRARPFRVGRRRTGPREAHVRIDSGGPRAPARLGKGPEADAGRRGRLPRAFGREVNMHRHHHRRGFRPPFGRRWYSSENVLERLESYQRDLEQELADVSDLIKRLRSEEAPTATEA